jgi:transcriptional regulator GlxA family with amidase domain
VDIPAGTAALGVRFGPGSAGAALGVAAHELRDRTVALEDVWGAEAAQLADRLAGAPPAERLAALAAAVARRLDGARAPDPEVARASTLLARGVPVAAASHEVALTDRHLRRRFHDAVGYGPKTLQRVMRLRRFLALAESEVRPDLARAAAEAGYSDQPHLTRECAELAGLPPAALLAARAAA